MGYALESLATDGTNISRTGDEADDSDMITASISGKIDATDRVSLYFGLRAVDAYSQYDPIDFAITGLPVDGDLATEASQAYLHLGGVLVSPGGLVTHRLGARYFDSSNDNLTDGIEDSGTASARTTLAYQADIRLSENLLSMALEYEETQFEQRGEIVFGDPNQDQENETTSLIADYQGHLSERFTWLLSARYDDHSDFKDATTGRLAVAWQVGESSTVRGSIGSGQKTPTFIERYGFFPGQFIGNPDLKPETSTSFEVGLDQGFASAGLDLQFTLFRQDLQDEINGFVFDPNTFLFTAENLTGDSTRTGVEIAASWRPVESLSLAASYTYTDAVEENDSGDETRELRRPRHMGSLSGEHRFFDERGNLALVADYGGSRTDQFFPPFPEPSEIVTLDAAWLVDLTIGFDMTKTINLFARATNLLDENYEQVYGFQARGRAGYIGMRVKFGE